MVMAEWKQRLSDFISALEEERRKIQMFSRELPLCLQLVNEAIDNLERQVTSDEVFGDKSVMEKGASNCKQDWLRSAQLWSPAAADKPPAEGGTLRKPVAVNATRVGRAFQPFEKSKLMPAVLAPAEAPAVSSTLGGKRRDGGEDLEKKEAEEGRSLATAQSNRKQRRCWSPALHRKFLNALEQLGGFHSATPKQIREMMMVDGLTNDEVKSHLQKYRLHMRRPLVTVQSSSSNSTQNQPHFVLVGSIWVPPTAAAPAAATAQQAEGSSAALNGIYSPVPSLPLEFGSEEEQPNKKQQTSKHPFMSLHSQQRCSQDDGSLVDDAATISNSSSTSFSSQTTSV
ncbi:transcription factor NIGT1 [Dendrobium catenatum]|uniref:Two-component response regulator ARR11 n=1 Tax=Dendrobium catenatum TaxID=906689 RepID=A0A2I0VQ77_9ASPA|nr:transcription factor NIGT1 [Dendrobium catenatum]PKU65560.1 Two-component response regulator ARR11 [Dendrobium catenatum]